MKYGPSDWMRRNTFQAAPGGGWIRGPASNVLRATPQASCLVAGTATCLNP
jgi:hypothetical protein